MNSQIAKEYISLISNMFGSFREINKTSVELSHIQNHVIEFMYMQQKALNLKEISVGLGIAKQQLTNVISDLEAVGYLVKEPDAKDKRAVLVSLTTQGSEIQEKKWAGIYQSFVKKLDKLSEEEQRDFDYALHKANILLKKMEEISL